MLTARERVVPALGKGAWWRYATVGAAIGLIVGIASLWSFGWLEAAVLRLPGVPPAARFSAVPVAVFALAFVPLVVLVRTTQRVSIVLAFAGAAAGSVLVGLIATVVVRHGDGGATPSEWIDKRGPLVITIWLGFYVAMALLTLGVMRVFLARLVEHRAGMCRRCGYELGGERIRVCPECGADADTAKFRGHRVIAMVRWCERHCGGLALLAGMVFVAVNAMPVWTRTVPSLRFYATFAGAVRVAHGAPSTYVDPDLPTVWIESAEDIDRGLRVIFDPDARSMTVDLTGTPAIGLPLGAAHVVANLEAGRTEWVLRRGLPRELVDALYAKAEEVAWMPGSAPRGEWEVRVRGEWFGE